MVCCMVICDILFKALANLYGHLVWCMKVNSHTIKLRDRELIHGLKDPHTQAQ